MEGRWTIFKWGDFSRITTGPDTETVPVVPCDDAAVERASHALYELSRGNEWPGVLHGIKVDHVGLKSVVDTVLRAAGETP